VNVTFKKSFLKDLKKIKNKFLLQQAKEVIEKIELANALSEVGNVKKVRGSKSYYRVRIGDYRMGLRVEGKTITFVRFLHRKDIYRYFP
jgi:mRNA interferase RelE/StbE